MGRASRAKVEQRKIARDRDRVLESYRETVQFLQASSASFDAGYSAEAKRLAVSLRVLLHDTKSSHSILGQLGIKKNCTFLDTAGPVDPANLISTLGLVMLRGTSLGDGSADGKYVPLLGGGPFDFGLVPYEKWWNGPVMKVDDHSWSRWELVSSLAHKEGGAHVDPHLDDAYERMVHQNGLGWSFEDQGGTRPFTGNPVEVAVRQVAYEFLETTKTLGTELNKLSN
ncbi:hypothetical protein ACI3EY_08120 [Ornithinimicrobium sp. LYQ92]|uniref:hypothetical protein n=1 Tax=Serinicoccus sp. LYQ92 TaxID=3378798 RepID=UPI003853BDF7